MPSIPAHNLPPSHKIKSLLPPLVALEDMGFDREACLRGTGVSIAQLGDPYVRVTFAQELILYRNILNLTEDPLIGLKLGEFFPPQRYGLFGYALISAPTFGEGLSFASEFGRLTFSFFTFDVKVSGGQAAFTMTKAPKIEQDLLNMFIDRDMSAAFLAFKVMLGHPFPLTKVHLAHDGHGQQDAFRDYFSCEVIFSSKPNRVIFSASILDEILPESDLETFQHFKQQCQMLDVMQDSAKHFIDDVRILMKSETAHVPSIGELSERLCISQRTMRRRLKDAGASYRALADEVRFELACGYLIDTRLQIEEVSHLLGYSEPSNFSHAFQRWSGQSPRSYRRQHRHAGQAVE